MHQQQKYQSLIGFLRHQQYYAEIAGDTAALNSINEQLTYTQRLLDNQLSPDELERRAKMMQHLKRRWQATFTDNRPAYRARLAASKLSELRAAA